VGHIIPAERYPGRHNDERNLRTMCVACNNSQRELDDEQWQEARTAREGSHRSARVPIFPRRRIY